jgi:hypothetical protein
LFNSHLKLRNYLVGYQLTLADVYLVISLIAPLQTLLDKKYRETVPNLMRFVNLLLEYKPFQHVFGKVHYCHALIQPQYGMKVGKKAAAPKDGGEESKKVEKKDTKKGDNKK